ncbi:MAG: acyltransferase [Lachnospiraceae bacterium]|nr:acyltransferase [Lachnospiraceae bacterium]
MERKNFDIVASMAIKGSAILMMLFHHLFRNGLKCHEIYDIIYFPFPGKNICNVATVFKICVGLFVLVSGYGLYLNYEKTELSPSKWVLQREIKLLSGYWVAVVCCWIVCQFVNQSPQYKYFDENIYTGISYMVVEFLGCSTLFGTPTLVSEWWYMSAAVIFVAMVPFVMLFEDKLVVLMMVVMALPRMLGVGFQGGTAIYSFVFTFLLGMLCAEYDIVNKWINVGNKGEKRIKFVMELVILFVGYKFWLKIPINVFWEFHYGIYPLLVLLFLAEFIIPVFVIQKGLTFFGNHSANMYFIHSLFIYYFSEFIYKMPHFLVSYILLLGMSLGASMLLNLLKKIIKYEKRIATLLQIN